MLYSKTLTLLLISFCLSHAANAKEFYKWTDDKGTVHYTEKKPENIESKTVKTYGTKSKQSSADPSTSRPTTPEPTGNSPQQAEKKPKKDPNICQQAKKNLQIMQTRPIIRQNDKVLTQDEKQSEMKKLQEVMQANC